METQIKKGLLEICILAALKRESSYGYKIARDVSACVAISESTLYPILKRLEAAGSVETSTAEYNGRLRRYYTLTDDGDSKIKAFLDAWEEIVGVHRYVREAWDLCPEPQTTRTTQTTEGGPTT